MYGWVYCTRKWILFQTPRRRCGLENRLFDAPVLSGSEKSSVCLSDEVNGARVRMPRKQDD
eukprot:scaffold10550_cov271-Chaetoceros_neogracile.AAC.33